MTNGYGHPESQEDRMAQRDMFATAAMIAITPLMMPLQGGIQATADAIANDAYVLAESMLRVRQQRPLP